MKCQSCDFESPHEMNFCSKCGCKLESPADLSGKANLRIEEWASLEPNLPPLARTIRAQKDKVEGLSREVTIMFCGLKDQMQKLSDEEECYVMFYVHHWEGLRSSTSENGILAVFGAVDELEDATQRAVSASIAIHKDSANFRGKMKRDPHIPLLGIGIYTGTVVIKTVGDYQVQLEPGDVINMAYQLEAVAEAGTTYVTEETHRLTRGLFSFQRMDGKKVQRMGQPISVYKVLLPKKDLSKYQSCKERMKTGDLLQWKYNSLGWWLYRKATFSKVNHSSMVLRLKEYEQLPGKRFTTESTQHGTILNRLSHRLENYHVEVWWYPLEDKWEPYRQKIGEAMLARIGIPFDFGSAFNISFRRFLGYVCRIVGKKRGSEMLERCKDRHEQDKVFCSEYCYWVYEECLRNELNKLSELPLPKDILKLGIFKEEKSGGQKIL